MQKVKIAIYQIKCDKHCANQNKQQQKLRVGYLFHCFNKAGKFCRNLASGCSSVERSTHTCQRPSVSKCPSVPKRPSVSKRPSVQSVNLCARPCPFLRVHNYYYYYYYYFIIIIIMIKSMKSCVRNFRIRIRRNDPLIRF